MKIVLVILILILNTLPLSAQVAYPYDWTLVYYMSYDNNLSKHTDEIISDLKKGLSNKRIAIIIESDTSDRDGLKRIVLTYDGQQVLENTFDLKTENSADPRQVKVLLDWTRKFYPAKKYVLTLLNHGGLLDQICQDDYPGSKRNDTSWMSSSAAAEVCRSFAKANPGQFELLFIQQCGRGSIENVYNYHDSANYILCSPLIVGAPNTYYQTTLKNLSKSTSADGSDIASWIMDNDKHSFFLTLVNGKEIKNIPDYVRTLAPLFSAQKLEFNEAIKRVYHYQHENYYDLGSFIKSIKTSDTAPERAKKQFLEWYQQKLILKTHKHKDYPAELSGLSIFVPKKSNDLRPYKSLPFYQKTPMASFLFK